MTDTMTDDRKALIERLVKAAPSIRGEAAEVRSRGIRPEKWSQFLYRLADDLEALSAEPSPDAAQGGECGEVPKELNVLADALRELASELSPDDAEIVADAERLVREACSRTASAGKPATSGMWLLRVKPKYQQGRGEYERAEHRGYTDNILHAGRFTEEWAKKCAAECPEKIEAIPDPYGPAHPPADAVSSVQDGGMVTVPTMPKRLLTALTRCAETMEDDASYDVESAVMEELSAYGAVRRHGTTSYFTITTLGQQMLAAKPL